MESSKPRVMVVSATGHLGGAERSLLSLIMGLQDQVDFIAVCPMEGDFAGLCRKAGVRTVSLPVRDRNKVKRVVRFAWHVTKVIRAEPVDVVHANNIWALVVCGWGARVHRRWLIWHVRDFSRRKWVCRLCGALANRVIGNSRGVLAQLAEYGVPEDKCEVVYNGFDDLSDQRPAVKEGQSFTFACIGQFVPWKGQLQFLKAAAEVRARLPEARFMLVGDDLFGQNRDYRRDVLSLIEKLNLQPRLEWVGWCGDMEPVWLKVDCLVHAAEHEPFGRVIVEAMLHGVPVVAVNSDGPAEIIRDGETGLLVPGADPDDLARAMIRIAEDHGLGLRLAAAARQDAQARFSTGLMADAMLRMYEEFREPQRCESGFTSTAGIGSFPA